MPQLTVAQIIQDSGVGFGTSGVRGLVSQFTDTVSGALAVAFVETLSQQGVKCSTIALAIDRRPSSANMAAAVTGALKALGITVLYYGVLPTPALALEAFSQSIPAIMITGSHIPFDRNGLKFYRPDAEINKIDEQSILSQMAPMPHFAPSLNVLMDRALKGYVARYLTPFTTTTLSGLTIGVYEHSAAGRDITNVILSGLGATLVSLGRCDEFVALDTEAISEQDHALAKHWSTTHTLDAIVSTDGDGDRPMLADENGCWLPGDILGTLCATFLNASALAVPISCNSAIESLVTAKVTRTKIGSPYVIDAMNTLLHRHSPVVGFEANGGFLCGSDVTINGVTLGKLMTRDALLPLVVVLAEARRQRQPISQLYQSRVDRFTASDRVMHFPSTKSQTLLTRWQQNIDDFARKMGVGEAQITFNTIDGLRLILGDGQIVHLRASGNAPELRCYCEANTQDQARALLQKAITIVTNERDH